MRVIGSRILKNQLLKHFPLRGKLAFIHQSLKLPTNFDLLNSNSNKNGIDFGLQNNDIEMADENMDYEVVIKFEILKSIYLQSLAEVSSVKKIESLLNLSDEKSKEIFDFICERMNLEKFLKTMNTKKELDLGFLNMIALFFYQKFVINEKREKRKPVVSIMGHVDHGKTTLLDFYRNTKKATLEVGGITQKIGGFTMDTRFGGISFIDTPGHAVFSNMRKTGASLADYVVVIISAVEGVQPQTIEVLNLLKEHQLPFLIAINKIDREGSDPESVEEKLVDLGVSLESYGGKIPVVHISAKTGKNTDLLLELLIEETNNLNLTADYDGTPECLVLETAANSATSTLKKTNAIIKNGIVSHGTCLTYGNTYFKVIQIMDDTGQLVSEAYPGDIVEIAGINDYPNSTEKMIGMSSESNARQFVNLQSEINAKFFKDKPEMIHSDFKIKFQNNKEKRKFIGNVRYQKEKMANVLGDVNIQIKKEIDKQRKEQENNDEESNNDVSIELQRQAQGIRNMLEEMEDKVIKNPVLIKVSNMGVKETIQDWVNRLDNKNFTLCGISCGQITEHDIFTTKQVRGKIVLFDLPSDSEIKNLLKEAGIGLVSHNIIYKLFEDLQNWKSGTDDPFNSKITIKGRGKVKKVFKFENEKGKLTEVAGCIVEEGVFNKSHVYRILRNEKLVASNLKIHSLKRFKDEVSHIKHGQDAGICFVNHSHFEENDIIESH